MSITDISKTIMNGYTPSIILAIVAVLVVCWQRLYVRLDPDEPPVLKPRIPLIGHIIGMIIRQNAYFDDLHERAALPIATLPMLNGKVYVITDPALIQNALKSKELSFDQFQLEFAQHMVDVSDETMKPVRKPGFVDAMTKEVHTAMLGGHLHQMNANMLNKVATTLNEIGEELEIDSVYLWMRQKLTEATCLTLLGAHSPMVKDPDLVGSLWDFDSNLPGVFISRYPSITARKAYLGREAIQQALIKYYVAHHDSEPDVARMTKVRADFYRSQGISDADVGRLEVILLFVSTANAIPTAFWHYLHIAANPSLTAEIRAEVENIITTSTLPAADGKKEMIIDITKFETECPLLVSSYRETIRLVSSHLGARRVHKDVRLPDGKGNSYLLKKGVDVQMPSGVPHYSTSVWGPDAATFNPRRFMKIDEALADGKMLDDREQKKAYFPFGGGKHLCPGRNFALAEILGTIAVLVTGFDIENRDGGGRLKVPKISRVGFGSAVCKPTGEGLHLAARLKRREGWEDVVWRYAC